MKKKEKEFLIMAISENKERLLKNLKDAMKDLSKETSGETSKEILTDANFMEGKDRKYYLKSNFAKEDFIDGNNPKYWHEHAEVVKGNDEIEKELLKSLNHKESCLFNFKQQILLDTSRKRDEAIARAALDFYGKGDGGEFIWTTEEPFTKWSPPKMSAVKSSSMLCFNAFLRINEKNL